MNLSLPSERFIVIDAPEVEEFEVKFVYNHFTADERTNDSGIYHHGAVLNKSLESFDEELIDSPNFNRFIPRYNKISWLPIVTETNLESSGFTGKIKDNIKKIYVENVFTSQKYTNIIHNNPLYDNRLKFFVEKLVSAALEDEELFSEDNNASLMDVINRLYDENLIPPHISPQIIEAVINDHFEYGHWYLDEKTKKNISSREANIGQFKIQVANKLASKLAKNSVNSTTNLANKISNKIVQQLKQIQDNAVANNPSNAFIGDDYDFDIQNIISASPINAQFKPEVRIVGYIINKKEITENGETIDHDPLIIESPNVNSTIDLKIRYGSTYQYTIQSVALVKFQAEDAEENEMVVASILLASKPTLPRQVNCEEFSPPPEPVDIEIRWDYKIKKPILSWNFPVNPQRDIKYFQIFKRNNINEPFTLLKMYDFDDSSVKSPKRETVDPRLIEVLSSPNNQYIDYDYAKGDEPIYAVCSVDAHGFTSNYSTQFKIKFDPQRNRLIKTLISKGGAPKPYPNFLIESTLFVDSIKTSGYDQVQVMFNPEYLEVIDKDNNDLKIIKGGEGDKYQLQLINIDLQEQQSLDIKVRDIRKSKNRGKKISITRGR